MSLDVGPGFISLYMERDLEETHRELRDRIDEIDDLNKENEQLRILNGIYEEFWCEFKKLIAETEEQIRGES